MWSLIASHSYDNGGGGGGGGGGDNSGGGGVNWVGSFEKCT